MKKINQLLAFSLLILMNSVPFVTAHGNQSSCSSDAHTSCNSDDSPSSYADDSYDIYDLDQDNIAICRAIITTDLQELKCLIIPGQELVAIKLLAPNMNFDNYTTDGFTFIHLLTEQLDSELITMLASHFSETEMQTYQAKLIELIKHAVTVEINIDAQNNYKETALMLAIQDCNIEVVQLLINLGANLEIQTEGGYTALHYALADCNYDATFLLIKSGANVNHQNADGITPLIMVIFGMIGQYALNHYLQEENPIIKFAVQPHAEIVRALLEAGADSTVVTHYNNNAYNSDYYSSDSSNAYSSDCYSDDAYNQDLSVMIIINAGLEFCKLELNSWTPSRAAKKLKRDLEVIKQIIEEFNSL